MTPSEKYLNRLKELREVREKSLKGYWAGIDFLSDGPVNGNFAIHLSEGPLSKSPEFFGIHHTGALGDNEQKFIATSANHWLTLLEQNRVMFEALQLTILHYQHPYLDHNWAYYLNEKHSEAINKVLEMEGL